MLISDAIVIGFKREIKDKVSAFASHIQVSKIKTSDAFDAEPIVYNDTFVNEIRKIPEVVHIQPFATRPGLVKTDEATAGVILKGIDKNYNPAFFKEHLISGRTIHFDDSTASKEIIISKYLADQLKLKAGDNIQGFFIPKDNKKVDIRLFNIVGVYSTSIDEVDKTFVLADLKQVVKLNKGWQANQIAGYEIYLKDFDLMDEVNEKIRFIHGMQVDQDTKTIIERYPQIFDWLNLLNTNIATILILMGLVAAINMVTALIIMILERTQMIGILKALGSSSWKIQQIFMYNAMSLIISGIVIGNLLSVGLLLIQKNFHVIKLDPKEYYLSEAPVYFSWTHIALVSGFSFLFCTVFMLLPSILVTRIRPVKAIRFE